MADTRMPADPLAVTMPPRSREWPEHLRRRMCDDLKPAGVLIPIIDRSEGLSVLLTQRAADLKHHAGQISFPGGGMEAADADISATALRETYEEVGIRPEQVDITGYLQPMLTVTGFAVTPTVGLVQPTIALTLDRTEVEHAFEVPLSFLLDEANEELSQRELHGVTVPIVEFNYASRRIWGATANMLVALRIILLN
ncbi:MAG: CoA pyrophosphatase [Woeseia sp.]